jgi:hypothetical protein
MAADAKTKAKRMSTGQWNRTGTLQRQYADQFATKNTHRATVHRRTDLKERRNRGNPLSKEASNKPAVQLSGGTGSPKMARHPKSDKLSRIAPARSIPPATRDLRSRSAMEIPYTGWRRIFITPRKSDFRRRHSSSSKWPPTGRSASRWIWLRWYSRRAEVLDGG